MRTDTTRLKEPVSLNALEKTSVRSRCWIVGTGPSLDAIDLSWLEDEEIYAINAAILLFQDPRYKRVTWVFRDLLAYRKITPHITIQPQRIITRGYNLLRIGEQPCNVVYFADQDPRAYCKSTTPVSMVRIAEWIGYKRCFILGCDCCKSERGAVYAKQLSAFSAIADEFQDLRFQAWIEDWKLAMVDRQIQIYQCSPLFPTNCVPKIPYKEALSLSALYVDRLEDLRP